MRNRRKFLKAMACAGAGGMMMGRVPFTMSQADRRKIMLGGFPATVIDVHAHCEIKAVELVVSGTPLEMKASPARIMGPQRIEQMDQMGIDIQAIHVGQYWWYPADTNLSSRITRTMNEGMAEWVAQHPDRFVALAAVSMQHPELAAEELEHAVRELGLRGASIGGHVDGAVPSSDRFDRFWAKAAELNVPVFMHPQNAEFFVEPEEFEGRGGLGNIIGNPLETTMFLSRLIFDGTFDRHPGLKIITVHGGGYLPSYSGRSEVACETRPKESDCANKKNPREYLRSQIFVDSVVFTEENLEHLVRVMGAGQVVYGTDIPYGWPDTLDMIVNASGLSNAEKEAILGGNLKKLLKIT